MVDRRVKQTLVITSLADADQALRRLGELQRAIEEIEAATESKIEDAKSQAAGLIGPLKASEKKLVSDLSTFMTTHRESVLGKAKSKKLNHGKIGFRKKTADEWPDDDVLVERLEDACLDEFVKTIKKPEKSAIKKAATVENSEIDLDSLGIRLKSHDEFFAEPSRAEVGELTPVGDA